MTGTETQAIGEYMLEQDAASRMLGIELQDIEPGVAKMTMTVRPEMVNGLGICHGGLIFSLADTAFAFACNSRNRKTVALHANINFIAAARVGDILMADAMEVSLKGRTGVYDVAITSQSGELVATFRGTSYGTSSPVIPV